MRKTYILSLISAVGALVWSCDLNEVPKDAISPDTFFHSESELELYTNQFYLMEPGGEDLYNEPSNMIITGNTPSALILGVTRQVPASGGEWEWENLRHINYYLQNSGKCSDESARNHYDGVAYFWRAWFYFDKLKRFGDVPIYDNTIDAADKEALRKPRDSREMVFDHILADLDKAIELLPGTSSVFKVNKYTALALKSRACLFEGTFRKYHAGHTFNKGNLPYDKILGECVSASEELMNSGNYALYKEGETPYLTMFRDVEIDAKNKEYIFARIYGGGNFKHLVDAFALISSGGAAGFTKALVASYLMADGSRFTDNPDWKTVEFREEVANRDPRLAQTILTQSGTYADGNPAEFDKSCTVTGYPLLKYVNGPVTARAQSSSNDMPIFRLAEVYLNFAEAKAELGQLTQTDLNNSVNLIRDRVKMPHIDMAAANATPDPFLTSDEFGYKNVTGNNKGVILEIRRERATEMVCEGLRYYDLCRWREGRLLAEPFYGPYVPGEGSYDMDGNGIVDFVVYKDVKPDIPGVTPYKIGEQIFLSNGDDGFIVAHKSVLRAFDEDRDYLYPIPTNDRVLTKGALTQNPGWDDGLSY